MPDIKELIELGASLGGEKLRRVIELANMEVREKGSRSINIPGTNISMTVHIRYDGRVELRAYRKDKDETLRLIEVLNKVGLRPSICVCGKRHVVSITHTNVRDSPLKPVICQKLSG